MLAVLATVQVLSILQETQTYDEGFELAAGYSYLKTGDYRMELEHPPLPKILAALPLLWLNPKLPLEHPSWASVNPLDFGHEFMYKNRVPAGTLLLPGRLITILATLSLGFVLALWTRREFGAPAALFALLLFSFDPNITAYGRYIKNDMYLTLFGFFACLAWARYLTSRRIGALILTGLLLGLALVSKFSALFLAPVFVVLYLLRWWQEPRSLSLLRLAGSLAALAVMVGGVVALTYAPAARLLIPMTRSARAAHPSAVMLYDAVDIGSRVGRVLAWASHRVGLRPHPFFLGLGVVAAHNQEGHEGYLMGRYSSHGWWYYFPVAFAVKTPVATLGALLLLLLLAGRAVFRRQASLRNASFSWIVLVVPILVYVPFCLTADINIGLRHLLPIYPFLFALIGAAIAGSAWKFRRVALSLIAVGLMIESLAIFPHYLAFFNILAGGPGNGPRYLLDSNIDWGQDVMNLKSYMVANHIPEVCICYFGAADLGYYGIEFQDLPEPQDVAGRATRDCVAAVSVTPLYGVYSPKEQFAWLRERQPMAKIGYSIYLYDLRKPKKP